MKPKTTIQWLCQNGCVNHEHQPPMAGMLLAGMLIMAGLAVPQTGLAEETTEEILTKLATPIKDIINMQELEGTTFHVINITEHNSVLPAEMQLAGKGSDWTEGICGYVDGKEVATGLISGDNCTRLTVLVPMKPRETKKVVFKKGKGAATTDLKVEQDGPRVVVSNGRAKWNLGPNGLEQFQRGGKTFALKETGIANGTLKTIITPAACLVMLSAEGANAREYLFYPNSPLWQVNADKKYQLVAGGTNAFYYSHLCSAFFGDPGSPFGAVIETDELEKGGGGHAGLKEFHLFSAADWGLLMDNGIGLGIYPNPSSFIVKVDTTKRQQGVIVQAVAMDELSDAIFKEWHWGESGGCGWWRWWRTQKKTPGNIISYVFGATADVNEGTVQRSGALAPVLLRSLGGRLHGAQLPWITANRSETIYVEDLDGNGPDMLNDRWHWCDNGKPMSCFEFHDSNKDGLLDDVEIYAKWDNKGGDLNANKVKLEVKLDEGGIHANGENKTRALDSMESKYPVVGLHDQTRDGKIVANCVFFGGRIDQDWFELNSGIESSPPDRAMIERKKPATDTPRAVPREEKAFNRSSRALDLDGDGDLDVAVDTRRDEGPDTDYAGGGCNKYYHLDLYDNNPFHGILLDPFTGNLTVRFGLQWPRYLGDLSLAMFRYKGVPVVGQDAVIGNICLDGDGLPEGKLIFDGGLIGDDFVFRPVQNMIGSSLYLSNRHALSKINSWVWQDLSSSCYRPDICLFPIRKNAGFACDTPLRSPECKNAHLMPKRRVMDAITTYRDKWGNEVQIVGMIQPAGWDGQFVAGSKNPTVVKDWSDSFHYDWDYLFATFEGVCGAGIESGYPNHSLRWEFCTDYAQRRQAKLFYSELDGRLHLTGASWGHVTSGRAGKKAPLDEFAKYAFWWLHEGYYCLDCDTMRYYATRHEAYFDEDRDGYLDSFLVDADNDGWYEDRAWYDKNTRTILCMKDGILVMWPRQPDPYPEEELLVDTEHYDKLVALKRMSEEKASNSVLKVTSIKAEPLSISVAESNLWVGVGGELLPQVLLDAAHCEAGIWCDLSPKGYSRLLTGLQRQKVVVRELKEKWSEASLRGASVLFVAPPYRTPPDADERKAVDSFMKGGGRVVVACPDWSVAPQGEIYALKADKPLMPDGKTGEWMSPLGVDLALLWDKPKPYRVKIQVSPKWDSTYFYLYAEVHDRDLINKESGADIWKGDCIQFALGDLGVTFQDMTPGMGDAEGLTGVCAKGGTRQEYGIARTVKGTEVYRWIDVPGNRTGPVAGAKLEVTREENRTIYQLALPWSQVGKTDVQAGTTLGFAIWIWDRASNGEVERTGAGNLKRLDQFRRLIFVDTSDAANAYAGSPVESPLDAMCASYGISRNNEQTALVAAIDPHFRQRGLGPEVWARFKGNQADGMMKDVRKLFFNGSSLGLSSSAKPVVQYQDKIIGARAQVGKGELLVFCSEMMLNNKYSCFHSFEGGDCTPNERPLDKLIDAKPDNNVLLDNLARYLVADQSNFKVLKAGDTQIIAELAGPGQVYVNKGTKVAPGGKETINGKESGNTMCLEVPASKDPIKLRISR